MRRGYRAVCQVLATRPSTALGAPQDPRNDSQDCSWDPQNDPQDCSWDLLTALVLLLGHLWDTPAPETPLGYLLLLGHH